MLKLKFVASLMFIVCSIAFSAERPARLVIGADEWIDYTNKDGSGVYFEILKKIFNNNTLVFKTAPFEQTVKHFAEGQLDAVVGVYREDVNRAFFPQWFLDTEYPILAFYDPKQTTVTQASDFVSLSTGWLRGYRFNRFLSSSKHQLLVDDLDTGFTLLSQHKIDAFLDYAYNLTAKEQLRYQTYEIMPARHIYVAFQHNHNGYLLTKQFNQQMQILRDSGELQHLYGKEYAHTGLATFSDKQQTITIHTNPVSLLKNNNEAMNLNFIFDQLNKYHFEFKLMHDLAGIYNADPHSNDCFTEFIKTPEREKRLLVSQPFSLFLGLHLYSTIDLKHTTPVNLTKLLNSNINYRLGNVNGRSYGAIIDQQLSKVNQLQIINSPTNLVSMFKLLDKNRFNLLIDYPSIKNKNWNNSTKLYSYKIEHATPYTLGHLMCNITPTNRQFINEFNQAISQLYQTVAFFDIQYRQLPASDRADFIHFFHQAFAKP